MFFIVESEKIYNFVADNSSIMKKLEITFTIYSADEEVGESSIQHEFHDKIIRSILRDAAAFKKEYENDTGEELSDYDYTYAEDIDISDVLFEEQYQDICNECLEEARNLVTVGKIRVLIDTDLAMLLRRIDESKDDD